MTDTDPGRSTAAVGETCHDPRVDSAVRTVEARGCPSDDELAGFVEHALDPVRKRQVEAHLDRCETCREAIGHVASTAAEGPQQIGRYRLDKKLGAGGMGVVWQAWDPALERAIAIKLLHPELHDAQGRERAVREARALARLSHPNVVAVHDVGEHEGDVFIATELIDGESLDRWQVGRSAAEIIAAYAQAARGLSAAHALGLVHRDVKPSNILMGRDGRVRVGDFGLATNAAASSLERAPTVTPPRAPLPNLTHDGERLGTPAYMAPEQQHSAQVDARADQYSLCLALAEALLGKQPGMDRTAEELAESGVLAPWAAIARGLATRPSDRFPDLAPLVEALEGKRAHRTARRAWIGGGLAVAALTGVVAWRVTAHDDTPRASETPVPALAGGGSTTRTAPATVAMMPPWTWTTPTTGPWRLPTDAYDVAIIDPQHAVAINFDEAMVIDLATGAVTAPKQILTSGKFDGLVTVGGRVLAFGMRDDKPMAWSIALKPDVVATEIPLTDPVPEKPGAVWGGGVVLSGDGARIAICQHYRWPTIRDAKTLEVIRVFKGLECRDPWFPDAGHVMLGEFTAMKLVDLATGTVTNVADDATRRFQGPNGMTFSLAEKSYTISSKTGAALRHRNSSTHYETVKFTPDGKYAVGLRLGTLTIRPANDDESDREIDLPTAVPALALTNRTALITAENTVIAVDLENGTVRHATGSLELIRQVAPRGGAVVVASDKLRLWREGKLVATTDAVDGFAVGGPTGPITVSTMEHVGLWDPSTGERRIVRTYAGFSLDALLTQHGDDYAFTDGPRVFRGKGDAPPTPWFTFREDLELVALDLVHGRVAWKAKDALYVAELAAKTVWALTVPAFTEGECDAGMGLEFAPDGNQFAVDTAGEVILFDMAARKRIGEIDLPRMMSLKWRFLPTGEMLFASDTEVAIWDPKTRKAIGWKTPLRVRPVEMAIDSAGTELAIGYANGSLLWADIAQLRLHATHRDAELKPFPGCAAKPVPQPQFEQLVTKP